MKKFIPIILICAFGCTRSSSGTNTPPPQDSTPISSIDSNINAQINISFPNGVAYTYLDYSIYTSAASPFYTTDSGIATGPLPVDIFSVDSVRDGFIFKFHSYRSPILDLIFSVPSSIAIQNFVDTSGKYPFSLNMGDTSFYTLNPQITLSVLHETNDNSNPTIISGTFQIICQADSFHSSIYDIINRNTPITITGTFNNVPNN
jgi:hypothetical protein